MTKTTTISVRMDVELKNEAERILTSLGLTASQAINVFYKQITFQHGIPFDVKIPEKKLNDISVNAMSEPELEKFNNLDELYKELDI